MEKDIKIKIDKTDSGLAYIRLSNNPSVKNIVLDTDEFKGEIVLDIDKDEKIVGIEIIGEVLPTELL
jgi:uncharacterized protein YuzE